MIDKDTITLEPEMINYFVGKSTHSSNSEINTSLLADFYNRRDEEASDLMAVIDLINEKISGLDRDTLNYLDIYKIAILMSYFCDIVIYNNKAVELENNNDSSF